MTFSTLQYYACRASVLILLLSGIWLLNKQFADYAFGTPHFQNLQASNVIQAENKLRGSGDWKITKPASNHEIEGFASVTSANPGEAISFYLNSNLSDAEHLKTKIDIYRMGWYEGKGGRLITSDAVIVDRQPSCPTSTDGRYTIECRWSPTHTITIPTEWLSGVYLAKLTLAAPFGIHGKSQRSYESYIIFVVRDDTRASHFVFQASVATYQAYNAWGGRDTYGDRGLSPDGRCWPYRDLPPEQSDDSPAVPSAEITRVKDAKRHQIRLHLIGRWRYPLIVPMNEATEAGTFFFLNIQCSSGSSEWATTSPISQTLIRTEPLMCCWDIRGFLA